MTRCTVTIKVVLEADDVHDAIGKASKLLYTQIENEGRIEVEPWIPTGAVTAITVTLYPTTAGDGA